MTNLKALTPFIFLALAAVVFFEGVWQQISAVQTLRAQVLSADVALKQAQGANAEQDNLVSAWQNLESALKNRVNLGVPPGSDIPNPLVLLNNVATSSGLLVESINYSVEAAKNTSTQASLPATAGTPAVVAKPEQSVLFTINARGDYSSIKAFVQSIQHDERIMDVQSIDISPFTTSTEQTSPSAGQASKIFKVVVTVKMYYGQ